MAVTSKINIYDFNFEEAERVLDNTQNIDGHNPNDGDALIYDENEDEFVPKPIEVKTRLDAIADEYDPDRNTAYPQNDMVIYDEKLYRSTESIPVMIGEFDETMWSEIPDYDPTETYQGATKVVHENTPYKKNPMVPSVTGEWNSDYWFEITPTDIEDYDPTSTTVYDALDDDGTFLATNASFAKTGGVGEFDATKWTETTVEQCLSNIHTPVITKTTGMLCSATDIRTDANGYLINSLDSDGVNNVLYSDVAKISWSGLPAMFATVFPVLERGFNNGQNSIRIKLLDGNGDPMASVSSGITDMGGLIYSAFTFTP